MPSWPASTPDPIPLGQPELAGIIISVSPDGFEAMEAFYCGLLRLPVRNRRPDFVNFEWPASGSGVLRLTLHHHDRVLARAKEPERFLLNLAVEDIDAWHRRLLAAEVAVVRLPERESWGGLVATYSDPDGNLVQLIQILP